MAHPGGNRARASPQPTAEPATPRHEGGARATPKERAAIMDLRGYLRDGDAGRPVDRRDLDDGSRPDRDLRDRGGIAARALIHDDRQAQDILIALNVHGLALGRHVLIDPSMSDLDRQGVLRHELRHVAQSGGGEPDLDNAIDVGDKGDLHERDAAEAAAGAAAIPIAPGGVNVVRYQKPDEVVDRQVQAISNPMIKKYLLQQAKHKKWVASRDDRWYGEIGKQAKTLDEEIDRTRQTVFAMRAHVLTSLTKSNLVPENLSERVASAEIAVDLLRLSLKAKDVIADDALPEEAVTAIRGPLNAFYFAAADFADEKYLQEWWRWSEDQQMADAFEKKRPEDQCKRNMCHSSRDNDKWMMTQGLRYQEPQSSEPYISRLQPPVDKATKVADWEGL
jgi:hypothetical protein